jgi:hypothetical protein
LAVALATILVASATPSFADESQNYAYGVTGNNIVFKTPKQAIKGGSFRLAVKNGQPGKVSVELVDVFSNASGAKKSIPLNTSPFTPDGLVELTEEYPAYVPSEEFQYFDISFRFRDDVELNRPVLGGVSISMVPDVTSDSQANVKSSIVATFAYLPKEGLDLEAYAAGLSISGPNVERITPDIFPMNLLPDLPSVLNHGDVKLSYELTNSGKIFLEATTKLTVEQVGIFNDPDKEIFSHSKTLFLVPGQQSSQIVDLALEGSSDNLLDIGIYRFSAIATGEMGDQISTSTSSQKTLVIFPWKQSFMLLVLLVLFRRAIGRAIDWVFDYLRAIRDFRNSRTQNPSITPGQAPDAAPILNQAVFGQVSAGSNSSSNTNPNTNPNTIRNNGALYPLWYGPKKKGPQG